MMIRWLVTPLALATFVDAVSEPGMMSLSSNEFVFVSRPDLRPPRFNVTTHRPEELFPGYWFIAPYVDLGAQSGNPKLCQIGPHIYDGQGELVWSGACDVRNRNSFDFKPWVHNGSQGLSAVIEGSSTLDQWHSRGAGLLWNSSYTVVDAIDPSPNVSQLNFHEFIKLQDTNHALVLYDGPSYAAPEAQGLLVWDGGFFELDAIGKEVFAWRALDHISIDESTDTRPADSNIQTEWDWFHVNAVDKDSDGNYLVSARHTDSIYKISGQDGSILWRLGGTNSSLGLNGFVFSRQHDARFASSIDDGKQMISFLNNAGDSHHSTSTTSAAYLVEVDSERHIARLVKQWLRPDGKLGRYRGNAQFLSNGNVLVHWGDHGYMSEFDEHGDVLQEAHLLSPQLGTYRAYKGPFTGVPREPIAMKCFAYEAIHGTDSTMCHISWNGATDVAYWELHDLEPQWATARTARTGFETVVAVTGLRKVVYAVAIAANEAVLEVSDPSFVERSHSEGSATQNAGAEHPPSRLVCTAAPGWPSPRDRHWSDYSYFVIGLVAGVLVMNISTRWSRNRLPYFKD